MSMPSEPDPAAVFAQPPSAWSRIRDTAATAQPGVRNAYNAGKMLAAEQSGIQSAPTHWGYVGNDASTHGTTSNGDGAPELATSEDIAGLHSRLDRVQESIGGIQSGGGGQGSGQANQNLQQLTPSAMPPRPPSVSPLAASAEQRNNAIAQMQASGQQLANTKANTSAHFAARQAQGGMAATQPTGNGMGASTSEASMAGALKGTPMRPSSGIGQSQSSFEKSRFGQQ